MVIPHRPAVLAAKQLATIDVLSGGRVILGIGAGWMKEEFEAIGAPPFEERGKVTDEYVAAFKELWTKDKPRFAGKYVRFDKITFAGKPAEIAADIKALAALGVGAIDTGFGGSTVPEIQAEMKKFKAEIMARL